MTLHWFSGFRIIHLAVKIQNLLIYFTFVNISPLWIQNGRPNCIILPIIWYMNRYKISIISYIHMRTSSNTSSHGFSGWVYISDSVESIIYYNVLPWMTFCPPLNSTWLPKCPHFHLDSIFYPAYSSTIPLHGFLSGSQIWCTVESVGLDSLVNLKHGHHYE